MRIGSVKRRRQLAAVCAGALLVLMAGAASQGVSAAPQLIKLGLLTSLTGMGAQWGQYTQQGATLAVDQINNRGKQHVSLVIQDDQSSPSAGISALDQLVAQGIKIIVGPSISFVGVPLAPIANRRHVILMSPYVSAPAFTKKGGYTFRTHLLTTILDPAMAKYALTKLGLRRLAQLYYESPDGAAAAKAVRAVWTAGGGSVVDVEPVPPSATDYRSELAKIAASHPDALYVFHVNGTNIASAFTQARQLGITARFMSPNSVGSAAFLQAAGSNGEGTMYGVDGFNPNAGPVAHAFAAAYAAKYGHAAELVAANAYDDANILVQGIATVGYDPDALRNWLYALKDYQGASDPFSFTDTGDVAGKGIQIMSVNGGKFVQLAVVNSPTSVR